MSEEDTPAGAVWFDEISSGIRESGYAIVCITRERLNAPWVLWESGALYGPLGKKSRVVPLLVDVDKSFLDIPLGMFQAVSCTSLPEMKGMLYDIGLPRTSEMQRISNALERFWPEYREKVAAAIKGSSPYVMTWAEQVEVVGRICGDAQLVALFAVNTSATIEQIRHLRWSCERRIDELETSVFVIPDNPAYVLALNSIASRVLDYMRGGDSPYVFGDPNGPLWVHDPSAVDQEEEEDEGEEVAETAQDVWRLAWEIAGLPLGGKISINMDILRHTFEHRLIYAGVAWEDIDTLMGRNKKIRHYHQLNLPHLLACAETVVERQDWTVVR